MNIYKANNEFKFNTLELSHPVSMSGTSYFTTLNMSGKPIYIETPQMTTKQGFVKNAKKVVCDLMFSSECTDFIQWFETLETTCHKLVYEKSEQWFQNALEYDDIENAFSPSLKTYKSGKYHLCRCNIGLDYNTGSPLTKIYNENELPVSYEEVTDQTQIISIIEVRGIKFTTRSFQLEFDLKQVMILKSESEFDKCLIKKSIGGANNIGEPIGKIGIAIPKYQKNTKQTDETADVDAIEDEDVDDCNEVDKNTNTDETSVVNDISKSDIIEKSDSNISEINDNENNNEESEEISSSSNENEIVIKTETEDETVPISQEVENTSDSIPTSEEIVPPTVIAELPTSHTNILTDEPASLFDIGNPIEGLELIEPELIVPNDEKAFNIKQPNQVYHEIYKKAKEKARKLKRDAINAILEANSIKNTYMLDEIDDDDSDLSDFDDDDEEEDEKEVFPN